jgi:Acyltransferase family
VNSNDISYNFKVAKVAAILMVTIYHYVDVEELEFVIWIPTAFALFIFAFSSGFFTSMKYRHPFSIKKFWAAKIDRLLYPIFVIDIFLFILFLVQQRPDIFTWQTLPSLIGMNGFFGWFNNMSNPSPFGAGLWFFTLLFLFYLFYPLISFLNKNHFTAVALLLFILLATCLFQSMDPSSPLFWMTQFAFIFGAYSGVHKHHVSPTLCVTLFTVSCLLVLLLNTIFDISALNYTLVLLASISIAGYLLNARLPAFLLSKSLILSGCIIQIYFIHPYLFFRSITQMQVINYIFSMVIIIAAALILNRITIMLHNFIIKMLSLSPQRS